MQWSSQQSSALDAVGEWLRDSDEQVFKLFGYAGTGKTTLAKHLAQDRQTCFAAYTGKAALVMRKNGCRNAKTIHSLIYRSEGEEGPRYTPVFGICPASEAWRAELIVIDECSMVDEELATDLLSFGKKVLVLGDPGQLPPVNSNAGYFTGGASDVMLTQIHRQALDNPILYLATQAREGVPLSLGSYGQSIVVKDGDDVDLGASDQLLVGTNATRRSQNRALRKRAGCSGELPVPGDRLICLRNAHKIGILNGEQFRANKESHRHGRDAVTLDVSSLDGGVQDLALTAHLTPLLGLNLPPMPYYTRKRHQEFDYAYALTVHKAQGSQWEHVTVYDEWGSDDHNKWLYTAITRAQEHVTIVNA